MMYMNVRTILDLIKQQSQEINAGIAVINNSQPIIRRSG